MKRRIKPFTLFLWIFILVYLVLGTRVFLIGSHIGWNGKGQHNNQSPPWTGIITLWDIPYVDVGVGSNSGWLNARIDEFERAHPGVFIDVRRMTPQRAEMYFAGNVDLDILPDIISIAPYEDFVPLTMYEDLTAVFDEGELDRIIPLARRAVARDDFIKGAPFMMGVYGLFINLDMLEKAEIELGDGILDYRQLDGIIENLPYVKKERKKEIYYYGFGSYNSPYSRPILSMVYGEGSKIQENLGYKYINSWFQKTGMVPDSIGSMDSAAANRLFADQGRIGVFLGNTKVLYRLRSLHSQGKGFPVGVYALPMEGKEGLFQDQIAAFGLIKKNHEAKRDCSVAFLKLLLSEKAQGDLKRLGMFPVVNDLGYIYGEDPEMLLLEESMANFRFGTGDNFWKAHEGEYMKIFQMGQDGNHNSGE